MIYFAAVLLAVSWCAHGFAQPAKVLFFEAALSPADMIVSAEPTGYSKLVELLKSEGMLVASMSTGEITREKLKPYEIAVLHCSPERPLQNREVSALVWFVAQEGGSLFVHGGDSRIVNPLIEIFGISMDGSNLIDPSSSMEDDASGRRLILTNFSGASGFETEGVGSIGFYGGSPLVLSQDASAILLGDEDSYSEDGFYSIGSFPPVGAVAYLGPGLVLVKSDRAMLNNEHFEEYENSKWAREAFAQLVKAHATSLERNESILGLRSHISDLEKTVSEFSEKIAKYEGDLTVGYERTKGLQAELRAVEKDNEELGLKLNTVQAERDTLSKALSRYESADVRKMVAIFVGAVLIIAFFIGFSIGRWSLRSRA
ncbi:MAG: hypothetical protein C4520_05030 [Candidatus Abyssobacteria bacterium SURF_5]|uniref:DUF4350 domain-containing protein n=1 Tax=Abyssobacteria bacterium (strain SURF_5) TaxID=2093360 RepID=A0A3A4NUE1_ABYX5|nr:MAG: hypothetical protein C4520_05030 [Candidatus Abyssubacteria bacterium SURF_5]